MLAIYQHINKINNNSHQKKLSKESSHHFSKQKFQFFNLIIYFQNLLKRSDQFNPTSEIFKTPHLRGKEFCYTWRMINKLNVQDDLSKTFFGISILKKHILGHKSLYIGHRLSFFQPTYRWSRTTNPLTLFPHKDKAPTTTTNPLTNYSPTNKATQY